MKALGPLIEDVLVQIETHIAYQKEFADRTSYQRTTNATPKRFLALAKTDLQTGLMYATRAVAQPEFF